MIGKQDQELVRHLVASPQWHAVENLAIDIATNLKDGSYVKDTEWGTIKATLETEGMIKGIQHFIQELNKIAYGNE